MRLEVTSAALQETEARRLEEARRRAVARVNAAVGAARSRYITVIPGQDAVYLAKETEARAFLADPAPDMAAYPMLAAEAGITAPDAAALAALWLAMGAGWRQVAAQLERLRMEAVGAIGAAATPQAVADIVVAALAQIEASG